MSVALDPALVGLIEPHTGPILETVRAFRSRSDYTGIVRTVAGRIFVKAVRDPSRATSSLEREAAVNTAVRHLAAELLWQARGNTWFALGFKYVPGNHASFEPGSRDLPAAVCAIDRIGDTSLPDVMRSWRETRWDQYSDGAAGRFRGRTLLHGDISPNNLLVGPDANVTIVDWAWPTYGAGFIDPACFAVRLIAAGHTPAQAEEWASRCNGWRDADPSAIDAFALATERMHQRFERSSPKPGHRVIAEAATAWAAYRGMPVLT